MKARRCDRSSCCCRRRRRCCCRRRRRCRRHRRRRRLQVNLSSCSGSSGATKKVAIKQKIVLLINGRFFLFPWNNKFNRIRTATII